MRRLLMSTLAIASLTLGAAGALAQSYPPPVPNASGSQVTAPSTYRATAYQNRDRERRAMQQRILPKRQAMKNRRANVATTGSVRRQAVPVPNASGSQVTSPETYRANAYQRRR